MSIVCTICQDLVTEVPQRLPPGEEVVIIALRCGHLFHRSCILEWFQKTGEQLEVGQCPCCKTNVSIQQAIRIYPSGDEESSAVSDKLKQAKARMEENAILQNELSQINSLLEDVGCQLENERVEHEILKYEYGQKSSQVDDLRRQAVEKDKMILNMENNWKESVENMQREKEETFENFEQRVIKEKADLENQFASKIQELEEKVANSSSANETSLLRQEMILLEKKHRITIEEYEKKFPVVPKSEKACQTDGRDGALLQARLVSYKSCMLHMQSEIRLLEGEYDKLRVQTPNNQEEVYLIDDSSEDDELKISDSLNDLKNIKLENEDKDAKRKLVDFEVEPVDCVEMGDASTVGKKINTEIHSEDGSSNGTDEFSDAPLWWH